MKKILLGLFCLALIFIINPAFSREVITELKSVQVYQRGATLNHKAQVSLEAGEFTLVFKGLSKQIDQRSIIVDANSSQILIRSVDYKLNYLNPEERSPRILKLTDSLELIQGKLDDEKIKKDVLTQEQSLILANKNVGGQNGSNAMDLQKMADFFRVRLTDISTKILVISNVEKQLKEIQKRLNLEMNQIKGRKGTYDSEIIVEVSVFAKGQFSFDIDYFTQNASWQVIYDLKAFENKTDVELTTNGKISQTTGLDWKSIKLTASTGNPSIGNQKPEIYPWYVDFYVPRPISRTGSNKRLSEMDDKMEVMSMAPAAAGQAQVMADYTSVEKAMLSIDYKISLPFSILSGDSKQVTFEKNNLAAKFVHYAVPKLQKEAFLVAQVTGFENLGLLPGKALIYLDNTYSGETYVGQTANDTMLVSLGRDKRVVVEYFTDKMFTEDKLFSGNKQKTFEFRFNIKNLRNSKIEIIVEDHIPVSRQKEIEIKINDIAGAELIETTGALKWKLVIDSNKSVSKKISFNVKYPANKNVSGI